MYERWIKRVLDCGLSAIGMILLSPVLGITALLVRIYLGSPVIFQQERPGRNEKIFKLKKFRTMLEPQTRDGRKITDEERTRLIASGVEVLSDEERLTKFGRFLRATSLDELPELWNIFIGDMSIVGPRPLSTIYLSYYNTYERQRHDVRPGLTGAAQVNGRNTVSWQERFNYDVEYVHHITFLSDLKILLKTVEVVLKRSDIGQGSEIPESFHVIRQMQWKEEKERKQGE
ncbi:MAG: sugar transferase [Lachnospiraceae bacterium]|nr:sugar transferase [Lachnospiraceae bacterium]